MSIIKIIANGIELDFVKDTLTIRKENNSLITDFKIAHSAIPFLVVENKKTKIALGTRDITSINKLKTIDVSVEEGGFYYYGQIQVLSYINGFRKCNLKYSSDLLKIMNIKIGQFMPIVSVIPGEINPIPFTEETEVIVEGSSNWETYPIPFLNNNFPNVKWQFPSMFYNNKYGESLAADNDWFLYEKFINKFNDNLTLFFTNTFTIVDSTLTLLNKNVAAPQVFLLSPLYYACKSSGYSIGGNFVNNEFIKRILFLSLKDNLTKYKPRAYESNINFNSILWDQMGYTGTLPNWGIKLKYYIIPIEHSGNFVLNFDITEPDYKETVNNSYNSIDQPIISRLGFYTSIFADIGEVCYVHRWDSESRNYKGQVNLQISPDQIGGNLYIIYVNRFEFMPTHNLNLHLQFKETSYLMHPTIQLGRYCPDWTFATYLNALKNFFNINIEIDDFKKSMILSFNENTIIDASKEILPVSFAIDSYEQTPYVAFLLKNDNDEDEALWITKDGIDLFTTQTSDFLQTIQSKFKYIPSNGYTANLSKGIEDKQGVGLVIYEPTNKPFISDNFLTQTLKINGEKGIYDSFFKIFLKFRLNASLLEMSGYLSSVQLSKVLNKNRIWIDNQEYIIALVDYKETNQSNYEIKFKVESINF